ncbi:hypothetical protein Nmel_010948 [Mimus melanotis]
MVAGGVFRVPLLRAKGGGCGAERARQGERRLPQPLPSARPNQSVF